ncbi:uncharacterized protein GIQ15_01004 [Arthroderma uncinatum]|uniref:uncharacterized protein n=1 Tax=Arthroderma uncinatum TaxID=74035 RepID=UPI00144A9A4C|nr:uncharacterized protein GIQ15_01004 [Arthroderma uncinatum]KAF3491487.1 hypothetical protein GIQ15_01004 [Arthroderma uncinatum]
MGSNPEFAAMPPPPISPFTTDTTSSNMINGARNTQISDIQAETPTIPQGRMNNHVPTPPMTYGSSSSDLSSVSSISAQDGFDTAAIATEGTPEIKSKEYNLPPTKPDLSLKYSNPVAGWRNIAPAPTPATALSNTTATATAVIGASTSTEGTKVALVSTPKASPSKPTPRRRRTGGAKSRNSRKSGRYGDDDDEGIKAEDSDSDGDSSDTPLTTTQTKSGRQIHRPTLFTPEHSQAKSASPDTSQQQLPRKRRRVYRKGKEVNVICLRCDRGHSPRCNAIVFCDECNAPWHQFCHDPPIGDEVITVKEKEWFCGECRPVKPPADLALQANGEPNRANIVYSSINSSTSTPTPTSATQTPTLLGSSQFSRAEKQGYLSSLSHAALVNLLMNISDSRPDIPLFPANLNELHTSSFNSDTSMTGKNAGNSSITSIPSKRPSDSLRASTGDSNENDDGDSDGEEVEEHRLYPRPGNGFRLPPDSEDLDILLEDPSSTTFSHALHGPAKAMAEANQLQMVGGIA